MKRMLATTALGLCLIGAPALAQTSGAQTTGAQTNGSDQSGGGAPPARRNAGVRPGYWAGLGALNQGGNGDPVFWAALVAAANRTGQADPDFWTALATAANRDNCADPECWAAVAAAKGDKTGLAEARLSGSEQKLSQVEHVLSDLRRANPNGAKSDGGGLPEAARDGIDQALKATREALHQIRDSIEALDTGGERSGSEKKTGSSGSSSEDRTGQHQQTAASPGNGTSETSGSGSSDSRQNATSETVGKKDGDKGAAATHDETGGSGKASTGSSAAMSGNKPEYLKLGNAQKKNEQTGASQAQDKSESTQKTGQQSQSGQSQAEQSQAGQSRAEQKASGTVWTFVTPAESSATRQGTSYVVTPKGEDSSKSVSQAGSGTAEQPSNKSGADSSKADKNDTKMGDTTSKPFESFASDQKSPRPYRGKPDDNTVSVNRLIAKKLYTTDGGVFGQVVDILLDSDSGQMKGVVVMRMGQSDGGKYGAQQPSGSASRLVVVPTADLKLTDGKWLITDLGHAG